MDEYVQQERAVDKEDGKKIVVQKKSPQLQERQQDGLFLPAPWLCGPLCLVPLDLLVLLRVLILLPLAIISCSFLGAHLKLPQRPVIVLRGVSLVTGDLNLFRVTNF